jgi:hypothetical protein
MIFGSAFICFHAPLIRLTCLHLGVFVSTTTLLLARLADCLFDEYPSRRT